MKLLDGLALSEELKQALAIRVSHLSFQPGLAVVLVGDDPASQVYVRSKQKACQKIGIYSELHRLPSETTQDVLLDLVQQLNTDPKIHGILVQLPLPAHLDSEAVLAAIRPEKDVDGLHAVNAGLLMQNRPGLLPCTPYGIIKILEHYQIPIVGKHAVIIGRSNLVGKPIGMLLLHHHATVTYAHSRTQNLAALTAQADILVAAVGQPRMVSAEMVKAGAVVIDVGINRVDGKLCGDVDFEAVAPKTSYITPVPKGVGPMTVCMLLYNTVEAAERQS